jgi:hypothetical protein
LAAGAAGWAYRDWLETYAARLNEQADRLAAMALRGQDTLALAAALDARMTAGQAVEVARELVARRV